ncbi:DNA alkylation repair protein [candidate division KSB1 bacterium]|nr:DNA alkylation repair protein [candidate division KSB1 bacterium]
MTAKDILEKLGLLGSETTKKIWMKHGAREPFFGVKIENLKKIQKAVKKNYELSLQLFATGNSDAMYLAALIAEPEKMTRENLNRWVENAYWYMLSEYAVAGVAAKSRLGYELAREWIESGAEQITSAGWATLSRIVATKPDAALDLNELENDLDRIKSQIHHSPNRVRYTMNGFVIAIGTYVTALTGKALNVARQIGKVNVDLGDTACKVPDAAVYIEKVKRMGRTDQKKK